eukprot:TRINITY_DN18214_c0_g1_i4.p1 TRINITY_DN18214_c0_g1~~TRINITY_DN18214_c0_g1_i4.p1  ORF type:complete len:463 (+),score=77.14 TRINITY_DN18214_c0_g1_i4:172-1389(+)
MEDAHTVVAKPSWGFFGLFDGHDGDQCAMFVSRRLSEVLSERTSAPKKESDIRDLMLRVDQEFLTAGGRQGGATATFAFVTPPTPPSGWFWPFRTAGRSTWLVRHGNMGDSRVLLGRADGSMVQGSGSDGALTTDHKPGDPGEKQRIESCGMAVEDKGGVMRINGVLAVSRGFGDAEFKSATRERDAVSCVPDIGEVECDESHFLLLVCDGVSEGTFPNECVVEAAAAVLRETGDPGEAASRVVHRALEEGSKDNISCMCVLFRGEGSPWPHPHRPMPRSEFRPGPYLHGHNAFREAYTSMARRGGLSLGSALALRYEELRQKYIGADLPKDLEQELAPFRHFDAEGLDSDDPKTRADVFRRWVDLTDKKGVNCTNPPPAGPSASFSSDDGATDPPLTPPNPAIS